MRAEQVLTADDFLQGERSPTLGPTYFMARRVAERAMAAFDPEMMKPLIEKAARDFENELWSTVQSSLWGDTEMNLQGEMWRAVDQIVLALLSGEPWAINKYALGSKYDCEKVRITVATHIPKELQDMRVGEMEERIACLEEDLKWARGSR